MPDCGHKAVPEAVGKCFRNTSEFVREKADAAVRQYYDGSHANLALIEVALYDHGALKKRNTHKRFVKALAAWGILDVADDAGMLRMIKGITNKFTRLPEKGYREWEEMYLNDKHTCIGIGELLGDTMKYIR